MISSRLVPRLAHALPRPATVVLPSLRSSPSPSPSFAPLRTPTTPRFLLQRRFASSTPSTPPPPPPGASGSSAGGGPGAGAGSGPRPRPSTSDAYNRARGEHYKQRNRSLALYSGATILFVTAASYLAVPLYRVFCSTTGYGGTPVTDSTKFSPERLVARTDLASRVRVTFNADSSDSLPWTFTPQQKEVRVLPGETALAFYTAKNNSEEDIIGIATYNVTPGNVRPSFPSLLPGFL